MPTTLRTQHRVHVCARAVVILPLLTVLVTTLTPSASCDPASALREINQVTPDKKVTHDLELIVRDFLIALEKGDKTKVASFLSSRGTVVGYEPPPIPQEEIRNQLRNEKGVYCLLLDSECLRDEWAQFWPRQAPPANLCSLQEALRSSTKRRVKFQILRPTDPEFQNTWSALVTVLLTYQAEEMQSWWGDRLDFEFLFEDGSWKLYTISYP